MDHWKDAQLNQAKEILAWELTNMVHGKEEADKAQAAARALFSTGGDVGNMPTTELDEGKFDGGKISAVSLLVACGLCPSNGEARRLIQQGGMMVNDRKVTDIGETFGQEDFTGDGVIIKKGKKVYHRAVVK